MNVTYVTAFHPVRSDIGPYFEKFDTFASSGIEIILFLDKDCSIPKTYPNVKIIPATLEMEWIPEEVVLPNQRNLAKDTRDYFVLMLHKLKYMNDALSHCNTPYLAWIDFGIAHVIHNRAVTYKRLVDLQSFSKPLDKILNPGCWPPNTSFVDNAVCWRFCGGFFLGPREIFPQAYSRQTQLVEYHLPKLSWEVNYWPLMEEYFTWYSADHDDSIIMNLPF